jgi:HSP20 family protein
MAEKMETTSVAPAKTDRQTGRLREPFEMFEDFYREMERSWPFFPRVLRRARALHPMAANAWAPRVDAYEQNGVFVVKAELPGVKKGDIKLTMEDGDLVIQGERKSESEVREEDFYRVERSYGSFYRRLALPFEAKPENLKATYSDGVLELRIPRPAESKPESKRIPVA